jgi:hypothetical protein
MTDGLWEKANEVAEVGYRVHNTAMIVELIAEKITDNAESGALWAVVDILTQHSERLELLSSELMAFNNKSKETVPEKKKK